MHRGGLPPEISAATVIVTGQYNNHCELTHSR